MKLSSGERFVSSQKSPYWTFSYAVEWIAFRRFYPQGVMDDQGRLWTDDRDRTETARLQLARKALRHALLDGGLGAIGIKPDQTYERVPATEWLTRKVVCVENDLNAPYRQFVVPRETVQHFWPQARPNGPGAPQKYDRASIKRLAMQEDPHRQQTRTHLADVLEATIRHNIGKAPSTRTIRGYLTDWGWE